MGSEDPYQQEAEGPESETSMQLEEGLKVRGGSHEQYVEYQDLLQDFPKSQLGKERNSEVSLKLSNQTVKRNADNSVTWVSFLFLSQPYPSTLFMEAPIPALGTC